MRRKFRLRRPGHGTVAAYLALFVALGGTAFGAFVVTSNSEIGPNTIYGHNAPAGANKNINLDSVTGADVKESTLARVPSSANGARKIDFDGAKSVNPPFTPIFTLNEMTLQVRCGTSSDSSDTFLDVFVFSSVNGGVNWRYKTGDDDQVPSSTSSGSGLNAGGGALMAGLLSNNGWQRAEGQFIYENPTRVITGTFHAIANQNSGRCQVTGTATQGPN
jgi:hypothetical protein